MAIPVTTSARSEFAEHQSALNALSAKLHALDTKIEEASALDALEMLTERDVLAQKVEHLQQGLDHAYQRAQQEQMVEDRDRVTKEWTPLVEERKQLLALFEANVRDLVDCLREITNLDDRQAAVIDSGRIAFDAATTSGRETTHSARGRLIAWVTQQLDLATYYPRAANELPHVVAVDEGQQRLLQLRLF